jgi:hypothetical protein
MLCLPKDVTRADLSDFLSRSVGDRPRLYRASRGRRHSSSNGFVTLWTQEREEPAPCPISLSRGRLAPRVHRRGAEASMRSGRGKVTFDVEGVVDGGVGRQEFLR